LVKPRDTRMGITQDQYAPRVTSKSQTSRNRAGFIFNIFAIHTILIVT
jgi:hypothetical protein